MIKKYINKKYINNLSEIISYSKDKEFNDIISNLNNNIYIEVTSHLIHKEKYIDQIEQFIFNLDNYITFIKQNIHINPLELKYIINLTLYNHKNIFLYSNIYYYSNIDYYIKKFKDLFSYKYNINYNIISKYIKIKKKDFNELVFTINNKKRTFAYFETISKSNISFYLSIYKSLEDIS